MLTAEEILALQDLQLMDAYREAKIEEKASSEFHVSAGFSSAKEYNQRKELLRYIIFLRKEMKKRDLEPEPLEDWLK